MKYFRNIAALILLVGCSSKGADENCRSWADVDVDIQIDLHLPQYCTLIFPGNSIDIPNNGDGGVIVANTGSDFTAWDARDPNAEGGEACSILKISGLSASSSCGNKNTYNLLTGQALENPNLLCSLRSYRTRKDGNILYITSH